MRLSWNTGYEDYTDVKGWQPRFAWLKDFAKNVDTGAARNHEDLRNTLEVLEELMRFYCSENDLQGLEPVMRKFSALLERLPETGPEDFYLKAVFLRINGMLYRSVGQNLKSLEQYDRCLEAAERCFRMLEKCQNLDPEQKFYVAWNCVECFREAAEVRDILLDVPGAMGVLRRVMPILRWIDGDLVNNPGIADKASGLYQGAGGLFWQNGDSEMGSHCFRAASRLLNELDGKYGSDFYRARAIWVDSLHGTLAMMLGGDANVLLQCEAEAMEYLRKRRDALDRDRAIVDAARAVTVLQRALAFQQNGRMEEAIAQCREGVALTEQSFRTVMTDLRDREGYYRTVMDGIAARIHNSLVGAKETLAVMYYQHGEPEAAGTLLREVLEKLNDKNGYRLAGAAGVLLQAETLQYLSLIASDEGNGNEAVFYGTQAADMAQSLGRETGNPNAWTVCVISCSLVSELSLAMKDKSKAEQYAAMGLDACDALERAVPNHPHLTLRKNLMKFRKKASRRFF